MQADTTKAKIKVGYTSFRYARHRQLMLKRGDGADIYATASVRKLSCRLAAHPCKLSCNTPPHKGCAACQNLCVSCSSTLLICPVSSWGGLPARLTRQSEHLVEQPENALVMGSPQLFKLLLPMSAHKCHCAVIGCKASEKNVKAYHYVTPKKKKKQAAASVATTHQALRIGQVKMHLCFADDILLQSHCKRTLLHAQKMLPPFTFN